MCWVSHCCCVDSLSFCCLKGCGRRVPMPCSTATLMLQHRCRHSFGRSRGSIWAVTALVPWEQSILLHWTCDGGCRWKMMVDNGEFCLNLRRKMQVVCVCVHASCLCVFCSSWANTLRCSVSDASSPTS